MILTKCYIENFGRHNQFSYDFTEGFNPIVQDNGWGKSTLAIFIKAMFYGLPVTRKSNFDENDRKKYMPWQGGNFGGYIEFKLNDREYRIERYFGKKEADDTFELIDLHTNKKSSDYDENIGLELFGLDADAYERTTFIPQKVLSGGVNESISAKLTNVIHGTDYTDNYERAIEIINNRKREIKNIQNRGELPIIEEKIYSLSQDVQQLKNSERAIAQTTEMLSKENEMISVLEKEYEDIKSKIKKVADNKEKLGKKQILTDLKNTSKDIDARIDEIDSVLNGKTVSRQALDEVAHCEQKLGVAKTTLDNLAQNTFLDNKYNSLNEYFREGVPSDQEINEVFKKNERVKQTSVMLKPSEVSSKSTKSLGLILPIILSLIVALAGALIYEHMMIGSIVCFVIASVIAVISLVVYLSTKRRNQYEETNIVTSTEISPNEHEVREFITRYEPIESSYDVNLFNIKMKANEYRDLSIQMKDIIEKIHKTKEEIHAYETKINQFFSGFGFRDNQLSNAEKINILRQIIIEQESLVRQKNDNTAKIQTLENSFVGDDEVEDEDISAIQVKEKELLAKLDEVKGDRIKLTHQLNKYHEQMSSLPELERELEELTIKKAEYEKELKTLKLTAEYLESAKNELSAKYLSPMKQSFDKYMSKIANGDKSYLLDTDLNVSVMEFGKSRELDYLSKGYQSIIDLCVRFALVDTIFEKERPFIILDDPFVNMDKDKISNSLELLNEISKDYQIIYLSCHESRTICP